MLRSDAPSLGTSRCVSSSTKSSRLRADPHRAAARLEAEEARDRRDDPAEDEGLRDSGQKILNVDDAVDRLHVEMGRDSELAARDQHAAEDAEDVGEDSQQGQRQGGAEAPQAASS